MSISRRNFLLGTVSLSALPLVPSFGGGSTSPLTVTLPPAVSMRAATVVRILPKEKILVDLGGIIVEASPEKSLVLQSKNTSWKRIETGGRT